MSERAIFVDGDGRIEHRIVEKALLAFDFPRLLGTPVCWTNASSDRTISDVGVVRFNRLGSLPDGRVVYAMQNIGWKLWAVKVEISREIPGAHRQALWDSDVAKAIDHLDARRVVRLYDVVKENTREYVDEREVWGVGIPIGLPVLD